MTTSTITLRRAMLIGSTFSVLLSFFEWLLFPYGAKMHEHHVSPHWFQTALELAWMGGYLLIVPGQFVAHILIGNGEGNLADAIGLAIIVIANALFYSVLLFNCAALIRQFNNSIKRSRTGG